MSIVEIFWNKASQPSIKLKAVVNFFFSFFIQLYWASYTHGFNGLCFIYHNSMQYQSIVHSDIQF